ncbi:hypothetical protein LshimejAT787_0311950 [Lyophyllum shimeji]|uniref:Uncharacterized protein n=1 Tax=Lyophyllum shimeji TaxID=47721 RepID=A0A9P3UKQ9_LYOSH|nr:hypothetical protein LshimejAT787_0311950 [Lyophyllum shimeji]
MTEYDFSPEAYQAHLANMHRVSKWVDDAEEHRPEFGNAAALVDNERVPRRRSGSFSERRRPPPLPLPPLGAAPYAHDVGYGTGMAMSPYDSPPHSASSYDMGFAYASGPGSPGPMPSHMYHGLSPRGPQFGAMMISPPPSPPHHQHRHSSHSRHTRSRSSSFNFAPPPGPRSVFQFAGMGGPSGYAPAPGYVILPPTHSRHSRAKHRGRPSVSYVYI